MCSLILYTPSHDFYGRGKGLEVNIFYITKGNISQSFFIAHPQSPPAKKTTPAREMPADLFYLYNLLPKVNYKKRSSSLGERILPPTILQICMSVDVNFWHTMRGVFSAQQRAPLWQKKHKNPVTSLPPPPPPMWRTMEKISLAIRIYIYLAGSSTRLVCDVAVMRG
jgi:hypothetical protein